MSAISDLLRSILLSALYTLPGLVIGFTVHEFCHALTAVKLGDPTPRYEGRVTLNPGAHIDWLGLLLFMVLGWGYARPVRINPMNLKGRKWGEMTVALAGPLSNLIVALIFYALWSRLPIGMWSSFLLYGCYANGTLCFLNLLPISPLDGFSVLRLLLPLKCSKFIFWMQKYGIVLLFALSLLNVLDWYLGTAQALMMAVFGALFG